ncbi:MAG: enoyl-CoA hydratase/isomerase family protein [Hyphomicrobiales bacterium]|nr:enoyl-CoA hydratase/isomerase family protein [Hyphomicrobiales bacterium]
MTDDPEILIESRGHLGLITLNRPDALNALTLGMVRVMRDALERWAIEPQITSIAIRGAGSKAFCAGGDILTLYAQKQDGQAEKSLVFWAEEYALNRIIKRFPKPYLALIDGIVMGGGVGVSIHGSHRIAGERFQFAMPEVGIGFFPDVGATYVLPRLPWRFGYYLALTGMRIGRGTAAALGIATHCVPASQFEAILDRLAAGEPTHRVLVGEVVAHGEAPELAHAGTVAQSFGGETVEAILAELDDLAAKGVAFAAETAAQMRLKSPTSLKLALAALRQGREVEFEKALQLEYRICRRIIEGHEFYEGIRAQVIDKDRKPRWQPETLANVTDDAVGAYFMELGKDELVFDGEAR